MKGEKAKVGTMCIMVLFVLSFMVGCNLFGSTDAPLGLIKNEFIQFANGKVVEDISYTRSISVNTWQKNDFDYQLLRKVVYSYFQDGRFVHEEFIFEPEGKDINESGNKNEGWLLASKSTGVYSYDVNSHTLTETHETRLFNYTSEWDNGTYVGTKWEEGTEQTVTGQKRISNVLFLERQMPRVYLRQGNSWKEQSITVYNENTENEYTNEFIYTYIWDSDTNSLSYERKDIRNEINTFNERRVISVEEVFPEITSSFENNTVYSFIGIITEHKRQNYNWDQEKMDDWENDPWDEVGRSSGESFLHLDNIMIRSWEITNNMRNIM